MSDIEIKFDASKFQSYLKQLSKEMEVVMPMIGNTIVEYSHEAFQTKSWDGVRWPSSSNTNTLVESGTLRRSVRLDSWDKDSCRIISDTPYSEIHNEGGIIEDTNGKMQSFAWAKFYSTEQEKWKWLALALRRDGYIEIPKRTFLSNSNELELRLEDLLLKIIKEKTK